MKVGPWQSPRSSSFQPNLQCDAHQCENLQKHRQPMPGRALQAVAADFHAAMNIVNLLLLGGRRCVMFALEGGIDMPSHGLFDSEADPILCQNDDKGDCEACSQCGEAPGPVL